MKQILLPGAPTYHLNPRSLPAKLGTKAARTPLLPRAPRRVRQQRAAKARGGAPTHRVPTGALPRPPLPGEAAGGEAAKRGPDSRVCGLLRAPTRNLGGGPAALQRAGEG